MKRKITKILGLVFYGFFLLDFILGCASMEEKYNQTKMLNSVTAYEDFLKEFPDGSYSLEAKARLNALKEEVEFRKIELKNSRIAYNDYIQKNLRSKFAEETKKRLNESDESAFIRTYNLGTDEAFKGFMESYPTSKYNTEINDYLQWKEKTKIGFVLDFSPDNEEVQNMKRRAIDTLNKQLEQYIDRIIFLKDDKDKEKLNIAALIFIKYYKHEVTTSPRGGPWLGLQFGLLGAILDATTGKFGSSYMNENISASISCGNPQKGIEYIRINSSNDTIYKDYFLKNFKEADFISWITERKEPPNGFLNIVFQSGDDYFKWALINALDKMNKKTPDLFCRALEERDLKVRLCAAKALCKLNDDRGYNFLNSSIQDKNPDIRLQTVDVLQEINNARALDVLVLSLRDEDSRVQSAVIKAFGEIKDPITNSKTKELVVQALNDGEIRIRMRMCAALVLCNLNDSRGYEFIKSHIKDDDFDFEIRRQALETLSEIKNTRAVEILILALQDREWLIQSLTIELLINSINEENILLVIPALEEITGKKFKENNKITWQKWWEENKK